MSVVTEKKTCECGCGDPVPIAKWTDSRRGHVKGQPTRFARGHYDHRQRSRDTLVTRFWARVAKAAPDECWLWTGVKDSPGYGRIRVDRQLRGAHRVSWEIANGREIPDGYQVDHLCHQRSCVNPAHLRLATPAQNSQNFGPDSAAGRGVSLHKRTGLWRVEVKSSGRSHSGGYFRDYDEACEAARQLRLVLHTHNDADRRSTS